LRPAVALLAACLAPLGAALAAPPPAISAQDAWIRATPGTDVAAAYLTLHNSGAQPVVVIGVRSPRAAQAVIHETTLVHGQTRMRAHEELQIAPGDTVRLTPGGLHIMLQGLKPPLAVGDEVPLELRLAGGGTVAVTAHVRPLGDG
jgi:periplasmic copper chaperone A